MSNFDDDSTVFELRDEDLDDDTDPNSPGFTELAPTAAAAALDGPVPIAVRDGPVPTATNEEQTAKLDVRPELMPEVARVIDKARAETQTATFGAMMDAMLLFGIDEGRTTMVFGKALELLDERRKLAAARVMGGNVSPGSGPTATAGAPLRRSRFPTGTR